VRYRCGCRVHSRRQLERPRCCSRFGQRIAEQPLTPLVVLHELVEDVDEPHKDLARRTAHELAERESSLRNARAWVAAARGSEIGLHQPGDALRLFPFELRFLARSRTTTSGAVRRSPPDRWVINLAGHDDRLYPR
jgi:hypothetical protein